MRNLYKGMAIEEALRAGVNPSVFLSLIQQESGFNPAAVSPAGAQGLTQIMPATGQQPGFGVQPIQNINDPREQLRFGADYYKAMLTRYGGDRTKALAAYNWGAGNVDGWKGDHHLLPAETQGYVTNIQKMAGEKYANVNHNDVQYPGASADPVQFPQVPGNTIMDPSAPSMGELPPSDVQASRAGKNILTGEGEEVEEVDQRDKTGLGISLLGEALSAAFGRRQSDFGSIQDRWMKETARLDKQQQELDDAAADAEKIQRMAEASKLYDPSGKTAEMILATNSPELATEVLSATIGRQHQSGEKALDRQHDLILAREKYAWMGEESQLERDLKLSMHGDDLKIAQGNLALKAKEIDSNIELRTADQKQSAMQWAVEEERRRAELKEKTRQYEQDYERSVITSDRLFVDKQEKDKVDHQYRMGALDQANNQFNMTYQQNADQFLANLKRTDSKMSEEQRQFNLTLSENIEKRMQDERQFGELLDVDKQRIVNEELHRTRQNTLDMRRLQLDTDKENRAATEAANERAAELAGGTMVRDSMAKMLRDNDMGELAGHLDNYSAESFSNPALVNSLQSVMDQVYPDKPSRTAAMEEAIFLNHPATSENDKESYWAIKNAQRNVSSPADVAEAERQKQTIIRNNKALLAMHEQARKTTELLPLYEHMQSILSKYEGETGQALETGSFEALVLPFKQLVHDTTGIDFEGMDEQEMLEQIKGMIFPNRRPEGSGQTSDLEFNAYNRATAGLSNEPAVLQEMLEWNIAFAKQAQAEDRFIRTEYDKGGKSLSKVQEMWAEAKDRGDPETNPSFMHIRDETDKGFEPDNIRKLRPDGFQPGEFVFIDGEYTKIGPKAADVLNRQYSVGKYHPNKGAR